MSDKIHTAGVSW